jgi:hypothetical protein
VAKVLWVNEKTGAADIAMDATNAQVLYATTWQYFERRHLQHWSGRRTPNPPTAATRGRSSRRVCRRAISARSASPYAANPQRVWATVEADAETSTGRTMQGGRGSATTST